MEQTLLLNATEQARIVSAVGAWGYRCHSDQRLISLTSSSEYHLPPGN